MKATYTFEGQRMSCTPGKAEPINLQVAYAKGSFNNNKPLDPCGARDTLIDEGIRLIASKLNQLFKILINYGYDLDVEFKDE